VTRWSWRTWTRRSCPHRPGGDGSGRVAPSSMEA